MCSLSANSSGLLVLLFGLSSSSLALSASASASVLCCVVLCCVCVVFVFVGWISLLVCRIEAKYQSTGSRPKYPL